MFKKDAKAIEEVYLEERECGHTICKFGDRESDLEAISEIIGVEMVYDENEEEWKFQKEKDMIRTNEALDYYYELHF